MLDRTGRSYITNLKQETMNLATFTITNKTKQKLEVIIPVGAINIPEDRNFQDTATIQKKTIVLQPKQSKNCQINTVCVNLRKKAPIGMIYYATDIIDPNITENMGQQEAWDEFERQCQQAKKTPEQIRQIVKRMKNVSDVIFQMILSKELELFDIEVEKGDLFLEIEDPRRKKKAQKQYFIPDGFSISGKDLSTFKKQIGSLYLPANVEDLGNGKLRIRFPSDWKEAYIAQYHLVPAISLAQKVLDEAK